MWKWGLVTALLISMAAEAHAQSVSLGRKEASKGVFVWKDNDAYSEAMKLIRAGVHRTHPEMLAGLVSCFVPKGTKAIVTDGGWLSSTVLIIDGTNKGCRGMVVNEEIPRGD